jgi:predicted nucleotidyltransferase
LELNRIGNNINQLTRQVNSGEANIFHKRAKKEIEEALTDLTELLRANTEALKELLK